MDADEVARTLAGEITHVLNLPDDPDYHEKT